MNLRKFYVKACHAFQITNRCSKDIMFALITQGMLGNIKSFWREQQLMMKRGVSYVVRKPSRNHQLCWDLGEILKSRSQVKRALIDFTQVKGIVQGNHISHRIKQLLWVQQISAITHSVPSTVLSVRNPKTKSTHTEEEMVRPALRCREVAEDTGLSDC